MWKEKGTLGLHVGGTLDFSNLEDKEASFDGTLVQMCLKGQLMVTHMLRYQALPLMYILGDYHLCHRLVLGILVA